MSQHTTHTRKGDETDYTASLSNLGVVHENGRRSVCPKRNHYLLWGVGARFTTWRRLEGRSAACPQPHSPLERCDEAGEARHGYFVSCCCELSSRLEIIQYPVVRGKEPSPSGNMVMTWMIGALWGRYIEAAKFLASVNGGLYTEIARTSIPSLKYSHGRTNDDTRERMAIGSPLGMA